MIDDEAIMPLTPAQRGVISDRYLTDEEAQEIIKQADESAARRDAENDAVIAMMDSQEGQDQLYPIPPMLPEMNTLVEKGEGYELSLEGVADPVAAIAYLHPEIAEGAKKYGIDLTKAPGRELEQMRKYFGAGSGLYLVTVDFRTVRTEAFLLDVEAQKKIHAALRPKRRKKVAKKTAVKTKKPAAKTKNYRNRTRKPARSR